MDEEKSNIPNTQETDTKGNDSVENPSRREFLKKSAVALGAVLFLSACEKKSFTSEKKDDTLFFQNVNELHRQYGENSHLFLNNDRTFNYNRYTEKYPELEQYVEYIEKHSFDIRKKFGIEPNIMKALSCSIICANSNNWEQIDTSKDLSNQRIGPMQFFPSNVLHLVNNTLEQDYSIQDASEPDKNIHSGMIALAESLKQIDVKKNSPNKDMMSLMLAHYYGGSGLVDFARNNHKAEGTHYLTSNYNLYEKTVGVLNGKTYEQPKSNELPPDIVWQRATKFWPKTELKNNWHNFEKQINKKEYQGAFGLSQSDLLALFVSVAMVESDGGNQKFNPTSKATGWYHVMERWGHIKKYNELHGTNYKIEDLYNYDDISIEVGVWTLMQYMETMDLHRSMEMFKGGNVFGQNSDDYIWWNRVSYCTQNLLGRDAFNMGYQDYILLGERYKANDFLQNRGHLANVEIKGDTTP